MGCDYKLIRDLLVTTSDLETHCIYYFDVIDKYYCFDDSDYTFYDNKIFDEPEITVLFERTGTIKRWHIDDIPNIKDIIDRVKNDIDITFDKVIKIEGFDRIEGNN